MRHVRLTSMIAAALALASCAASPALDARTAAWWETTQDLSSDVMEGRDTGSPGYDRAANVVAARFDSAGLIPAGDDGGWMQIIAFKDVEVTAEGTSLTAVHHDGTRRQLRFLHEISVGPQWGLASSLDAPMVWRGWCRPEDMTDVSGKIVVCLGARREGQTTGGERLRAATQAGAVAIVNVDDMSFTVEPPRWPLAYARNVILAETTPGPATLPSLRMAAPTFEALAQAAGVDGASILAAGGRNQPMMSFDFRARLEATFALRERAYTSANVLGMLPGTDPALADQPILLIAHLDGYGYGTPVDGDELYNGTFDDAAYVATLTTLAAERAGRGWRRPVIFAAVTGEEKGLWGSRWLAANPTPGAPTPVAVLNLDQLRPLYPLTILTTLALDDSTLGQTVRDIAGPMGIEVRPDREPERGLIRRSDHWPFMQRGVPAVSFLFGFDYGTPAHDAYLDWYRHRYHAPQDDVTTPIDFQAQADFHTFWFALVEAVADAEQPPQWLPDAPNRPGGGN
ncbi:M28 family metallopeptidase [Brevundimonas sp.]|uniref:M28 family metallopeptidase n=1 Tax=Brevundimonas sp. TaxID=1871086 RepID=UPI002632B3E2|nr:M28 family metallopeptidase [Brevundimonas sp.]